MDRQELQARRGENQVWNGSGNYAVKPDYLAFDPSGDPELYWNTIMGAAARRCDFARFQPLLSRFFRIIIPRGVKRTLSIKNDTGRV